ncbi:hypothetical protein [Tenacibaculum aiptasiae]|uniref:hypothetical protein n=1 Tax=Tenacibaculum aiptasiae TaxID=426481 RepID=UPI003B5A9542
MKRIVLSIGLVLTGLLVNAQNKLEATGFAGVGISTPQHLMHIKGNHSNTRLLLHSVGGGIETRYADLMLWASEPGLTYSGVGIGNNVINSSTSPYLTRISNERGASYMRLLEENIMFNVITKSGDNINALNINSDGFVGIGTISPNAKLHVEGIIQAGNKDSTKGGVFLAQKYGGNDYIGTLSSNYSSGALILGYGAAGMKDQGASGQLVSTFDNFSARRSALRLNKGTLEFLSTQNAVQTTVGDELSVSSRFYIDENGNAGIGTRAPTSKLTLTGDFKSVANKSGWAGWFENTGVGATNSGLVVTAGEDSSDHILLLRKQNGTETLTVRGDGNVGIGTTTPDSKLAVNGKIHTKEVKVDLIGWYDFVFEKDYNLPTIEEVEKHIKEKGHLKDIPSEKEVLENGIHLGEMNGKLLQKIEELTLYTIQQEKKIKEQEKKMNMQEKKMIVQEEKIKEQEEQLKSLKDLSNRLSKLEKFLKGK